MRTLPFHSKPKTRQRPEARLQKAVVQLLLLNSNAGVLWFSVPNEGKRHPRTAEQLKSMGMCPGAADLCVIVDGQAHFLELKAGKNPQTELQRDFEAWCDEASAEYCVVRDIEDAAEVLRSWGALKSAKSAKVAA